MKKLLALLLAAIMMVSLSVVAMAAEIGPLPDKDPDQVGIQWGSTVWVDNGNGYLTPSHDWENPGTKFYVPVLYTDPPIESLKMVDFSYYKLSYKIVEGANAVKSVTLKERHTFSWFPRESGLIEVVTLSNYIAGEQEVVIDLVLTPKKTPKSEGLNKLEGRFTANLAYDTEPVIPKDPTVLSEGIYELDFDDDDFPPDKHVSIELDFGGQAYFLSKVRTPKNVVASLDTDPVEEIEEAYPKANLDFLDLRSGTFRQSGDLYIPADDDDFLYELVNGKLVASKAVYDEDEEAFILKGIKKLGFYVISDTKLEIAGSEVENPETGVGNVIGIAAALAVVSLVAAGAVSLKK